MPSGPGPRPWEIALCASCVAGFAALLFAARPQLIVVDDAFLQHLPASRELARLWLAGELPLLTPRSWFGGYLAGEYQYGVFSLAVSGLAVLVWSLGLSVKASAALLAMAQLVLFSTGTLFLARRRGLPPPLACLAAVCVPLSGWALLWGATRWHPGLAAFAWLPWAWWALQRALEPGAPWRRVAPAALFTYLLLAGGWPFANLSLVLVTLCLGVRATAQARRPGPALRLAVAWTLGLGLAMPALLPFLDHLAHSARGMMGAMVHSHFHVPASAYLGLFNPAGPVTWSLGGNPRLHDATQLFCGLVPAALLLHAVLLQGRRLVRRRPVASALLVMTVILAALPGLWNLMWSTRWLPLLHLVLALLALHGAAMVKAERGNQRYIPGPAVLAGLFIVAATARAMVLLPPDGWRYPLLGGGGLLLLSAGWWFVERLRESRPRLAAWAPLGISLLAFAVAYLNPGYAPDGGRWRQSARLERPEPLSQQRTYLAYYTMGDLYRTQHYKQPEYGGLLRPGLTGLHAGLHFINGYSALQPRGLASTLGLVLYGGFGHEAPSRALAMLAGGAGPGGLLHLLGVDGLVLARRFDEHVPGLIEQGWERIHQSEEATILHRQGARPPRVRFLTRAVQTPEAGQALALLSDPRYQKAPMVPVDRDSYSGPPMALQLRKGKIKGTRVTARRVEVDLVGPADKPSLLLFSRPWFPGYQATLNGTSLPVVRAAMSMPAVKLPAGARGRLVLDFLPPSLQLGLGLAALSAGVLLLLLLLRRQTRQEHPASGRAPKD